MKNPKPFLIILTMLACIGISVFTAFMFSDDSKFPCNRCFGEGVIYVDGDYIDEGKGGYYEEIQQECNICGGVGTVTEVGKPSVTVFAITFGMLVVTLGTALGLTKGTRIKLLNVLDFSKSGGNTSIYKNTDGDKDGEKQDQS